MATAIADMGGNLIGRIDKLVTGKSFRILLVLFSLVYIIIWFCNVGGLIAEAAGASPVFAETTTKLKNIFDSAFNFIILSFLYTLSGGFSKARTAPPQPVSGYY